MKIVRGLAYAILLLAVQTVPVLAQATPPPVTTPNAVDTGTGFPWGLVLVFILAGIIMTFIKKNNPNQVTSCTCLPLINDEQQAREKARFSPESEQKNNTGKK